MLKSPANPLKDIAHYVSDAVGKENKSRLYSLLAILLIAIGVRVFFLFQPMRYDESFTFLRYASKPFYVGLSDYSAPNNHLFHTFLVHIVYILLGNKPWVIRLPALFSGIFLVFASYAVIRKFYNKDSALLAAGIIASSSALIEYSTNARGYSLICLFFLLILGLATYLKRSTNSYAWLLFAILSALGFYTIPIMLYPFGIVVTWLLLSIVTEKASVERGRLVKNLFRSIEIAGLLTVLLYLPVFVVSGVRSVVANQFVARLSWSDFVRNFLSFAHIIWDQWNRDIPIVLQILIAVGFLASLAVHKRLSNYPVPIILAAIVWLLPVLAIQRVIPPTRVWLFLLPIYVGMASAGGIYVFGRMKTKLGRKMPAAVPLLAVALSLFLSWNTIKNKSFYYTSETMAFPDAEKITMFLKDYLKPGDRVLAVGTYYYPLKYYFLLHNVPDEYLSETFADLGQGPGDRILFLVNDLCIKSGPEAMKKVFADYSAPEPIKPFRGQVLFEIRKKKWI